MLSFGKSIAIVTLFFGIWVGCVGLGFLPTILYETSAAAFATHVLTLAGVTFGPLVAYFVIRLLFY